MTTTLRPAAPEQRTEQGRSRPYEIRVNGRRAGALTLSCSGAVGRVADLEVGTADRRRGRATVAALAAEEILRAWGCRTVVATVPAGAREALALAAVLGYAERSRVLVTTDLTAPDPPPGTADHTMTDTEYATWRERDHAELVRRLAAAGRSPEDADRRAREDAAALLPDGPRTAGSALRTLTHHGVAVGMVWLALNPPRHPDLDAYVYAVEVDEPARGRGHGRSLMHLAARLAREAGAARLGLTVHTDNAPARRLYASLGYEPLAHHLGKRLV